MVITCKLAIGHPSHLRVISNHAILKQDMHMATSSLKNSLTNKWYIQTSREPETRRPLCSCWVYSTNFSTPYIVHAIMLQICDLRRQSTRARSARREVIAVTGKANQLCCWRTRCGQRTRSRRWQGIPRQAERLGTRGGRSTAPPESGRSNTGPREGPPASACSGSGPGRTWRSCPGNPRSPPSSCCTSMTTTTSLRRWQLRQPKTTQEAPWRRACSSSICVIIMWWWSLSDRSRRLRCVRRHLYRLRVAFFWRVALESNLACTLRALQKVYISQLTVCWLCSSLLSCENLCNYIMSYTVLSLYVKPTHPMVSY